MSAPADTEKGNRNMSEPTRPTLQEQLTARIGETVAMYGRDDFTVISVHSREAKIEAPKVGRSKPAVTKYPKLRTLAAAFAIPETSDQSEAVTA